MVRVINWFQYHSLSLFVLATTPRLRTAKGCEHYPAVYLQCNRNETIRIHDAFYGRNNGDNSCHFTGTVTCVNPNATEIVRRICNDNSTCSISPKGSIWNFDPLCDDLNAQLVVHYMCISKGKIYLGF